MLAQEEERQRRETEDLIRGFNFPAVVLTLGRTRWKDTLRDTYLRLAREPSSIKLRRTLAASVGEVARIIGSEQAHEDLVRVWWESARCDEEEVRIKLVESLEMFVDALDIPTRVDLLRGVLKMWEEGGWKGWREREGLAGTYQALCGLVGAQDPGVIRGLVNVALQDPVAAVREAAIRVVRIISLTLQELAILVKAHYTFFGYEF
jgi:serine/threonine-protein phosphatase 4 regulatory subunit 1